MRALVVDDSKAIRIILTKMLKEIGFDVAEACDGHEAMECLKENGHPAVVLVDWNMPRMSGIEFVEAVRADHAYDDMQLVMVTTETEMEQVAYALEAGANEYVMKPFNKNIILEKLEMLGITTE